MANQNIFIIADADTGSICCVVKTDKPYKIVQDAIDKYRKENPEDPNWEYDELKEYLLANGYELIEYEEVYF